jgi:hypothetical protein
VRSRAVRDLPFAPLAWSGGAALCALIALQLSASDYLLHQGFPLDDAWIHAVYAREFARSGSLAYNPGIPATGETSPLWAVMVAVVHRVSSDAGVTVALTKALGFALHVASAALLAIVLGRAAVVPLVVSASVALAAFHPDLMAASVSGMEVPLATLIIAAVVAATLTNAIWWVAALGAVAVVGRPETAVIAVLFPLLFAIRQPNGWRLALVAAAGVLASTGIVAVRNAAVSGMYLPATFHAKVDVVSPFALTWQADGFHGLLGQLPLLHPLPIVITVGAVAVVLAARAETTTAARAGAALYVSGLVFCAASFALVHPRDPVAFYHQRYVLPALFGMVAGLPLLADEMLRRISGRAVRAGFTATVVALAVLLIDASPARYRRLSNDARNIDDVQVAVGRSLASASAADSVWVVDAGASRFFGTPFVVDLIGLNTPEVLGSDPYTFLNLHRPRYLERVDGWLEIESTHGSRLSGRTFEASTPFTVTGDARMRRHELLTCAPPDIVGRVAIRGRLFPFQCPSAP